MSDLLFDGLFEEPKLRTPKQVLESFKQAVEAESKATITFELRDATDKNNGSFLYMFMIKSLTTNYAYNLLNINYNVLLYPCMVITDPQIFEQAQLVGRVTTEYINSFPATGVSATSEEDLIEVIKMILKTEKVRAIVRSIYSQS